MRRYFAFIFVLLMAATAWGQAMATMESPLSNLPGSRVLKTFDFEETKLGNYEAVPMYWSKVVGRGFPAYSSGAFDHAVARSANTSFRLETSGGSVAYRFTPPDGKRILIYPNADYYVLAFVKTTGLQHARADLAGWFADEKGNLLPASETHSQSFAGAAGGDTWEVLYIYMPGPEVVPEAATQPGGAEVAVLAKSLVLQMGLLQPQQLSAEGSGKSDLGKFEIYQQDISGSVRFDDIVVFQLPRVTASVPGGAARGNIFGPGQNVDLDLMLSDFTGNGQKLQVRMRITGADGLVMATEQWQAATTPETPWSKRYSHAPLPAGKYKATLEVLDGSGGAGGGAGGAASGGALIARRESYFLCMGAEAPTAKGVAVPAGEFGLGITSANHRGASDDWAIWPALLKDTGAGLLQVPAWRKEMTEEALTRRDPAFETFLATLSRANVQTIGTLAEVPAGLAARLPASTQPAATTASSRGTERDSLLWLADVNADIWRPYLSFALTRYAHRIDTWELGDPRKPFSGGLEIGDGGSVNQFSRLYAQASTEMAGLMLRPKVVIPWNALFDYQGAQFPGAVLDLRLPAAIRPSQIPAYIDNFRQASGPVTTAPAGAGAAGGAGAPGRPKVEIYAHLDAAGPRQYSHADRLIDFAQRVVYARTANPQCTIYDPVTALDDGSEGGPDEMLIVYRALIRALGHADYVGELPVASGVHAFLFHRAGEGTAGLLGGTLVVWSESANAVMPLDLPLGAAPRMTDILGNGKAIKADAATGLTRVLAGAMPVIIDQFDPRPLQLKTSFALATSILPAGVGVVHTEVTLTNPYAEGVTGTLRINAPKGWSIEPPSVKIVLGPGASLREPVTIRYPFSETLGTRPVTARISLDAGAGGASNKGQEVEAAFPVTVSSDVVQMEAFTQLAANGDVLIEEMVTNISDGRLDAQAYAVLPGYPRQQRYVVGLGPGETTIKRFLFSASMYVGEEGASPAAVPKTPGQIGAALIGKEATLGLRQNDGMTLLTRTVKIQ